MDQDVNEKLLTPIVAILCQSQTDDFYATYLEPPATVKELDFQEDQLIVRNMVFNYRWFDSIAVCTEETLKEFKQELSLLQ